MGFWTITVWESQGAMINYMSSGKHLTSMARLPEWCSEAITGHEEVSELAEEPVIEDSKRVLLGAGKFTSVKFPTPDQSSKKFSPPDPFYCSRFKKLKIPEQD